MIKLSNFNIQDNIDKLKSFTVKIITDRSIGTGFIVTESGIIVTCYHVIGDRQKKSFFENIRICPVNSDNIIPAQVLKEVKDCNTHLKREIIYADPINDIAFLEPDYSNLNIGVTKLFPCQLTELIKFDNNFVSIGFKDVHTFNFLSSSGKIRIPTKQKIHVNENIEEISVIQLDSQNIDFGMSGSPVFDLQINKVIGIISFLYKSNKEIIPFAIPVETMIKVYPQIKEKNPGLSLLNQFLENAKIEKKAKYKNFDDIYVSPKEYPDIRKILEDKRCVFITGTPEYGKTFTAIKLMWDKWKESDLDIRIKYPETLAEKNKILDIVDEDDSYSNCIIYLEDPTGQPEYTPNVKFEESIVRVIEKLSTLKSYLIITMRENIYQETKSKIFYNDKLEEYIYRLEIKQCSYDFDLRKAMLLGWANRKKCKWLDNDEQRNMVLKNLKEEKLPTPLNIYEFALNTGENGKNITSYTSLEKEIERLSQRTSERFAKEIINLKDNYKVYKVLFLCFPFISGDFHYLYVKNKFIKLIKEYYSIFKNEEGIYDRIVYFFKSEVETLQFVRFVHSSYSSALSFILVDSNGFPSEDIIEIFSKVLLELSNDAENSHLIASIILRHPKALLRNIDLIYNLLENKSTGMHTASVIHEYFNNIPEEIRSELLVKLSSISYTQKYLSDILTEHFIRISKSAREDLLVKLSNDQKLIKYISKCLLKYFEIISSSIKKDLLTKIINSSESFHLAISLIDTFTTLPISVRKDILVILCKQSECSEYTAKCLQVHFKEISENLRTQLILELAKNNNAIPNLFETIIDHYFALPSPIRNLLHKLPNDDMILLQIAIIISNKFDKIPLNIRESILKSLLYTSAAGKTIMILAEHFDCISSNLKNLIFPILDQGNNSRIVSSLLVFNFHNLNKTMRELLLIELSKKEITYVSLARCLIHHYNRISPNLRNDLLKKFAGKDKASEYVTKCILNNSEALNSTLGKEILFDLSSRNNITAAKTAEAMIYFFNRIPVELRDDLIIKLIKKKKSHLYLSKILVDNFYQFSIALRNYLIKYLANTIDAAPYVAETITENFDNVPIECKRVLLFLIKNDKAFKIIDSFIVRHTYILNDNFIKELKVKINERYQPN